MKGDGAILKQGNFPTTGDDMEDFLAGIDEAKIALESSGFCMPWVEFLENMGFEVFVAHPAKVKIIAEARIKTDKIDSEALAHLLCVCKRRWNFPHFRRLKIPHLWY
jgi:transposase